MYFARNMRSVPIVLPASGALPSSGTNRWMYSSASNSASATLTPSGISVEEPGLLVHRGDEVVHVLRARRIRLDDDREAGVERSKLEVGDDDGDLDELVDREVEPVISQSIQTRRSFSEAPTMGSILVRGWDTGFGRAAGPSRLRSRRDTLDSRLRSSVDRAAAF